MSIHDIRNQWNTDSLMIAPAALMRLCKQIAGRQQKEALLLKQPCDCTPDKLFALYHIQRGKCALTGYPLTYSKGERLPTSIEIDHINEVMRHQSFYSVTRGGSSVGGMSGMMTNLRFVCRLAHQLRHKLDSFSVDTTDLYMRLYVASEIGPPRNTTIDIENSLSLLASQDVITEAVAKFVKSRPITPSCKQVAIHIKNLGLMATSAQIYQAVAAAGVCGRSGQQRSRVAIAVEMLGENEAFVDAISKNRIPEEMKQEFRVRLNSLAEINVHDLSLRDDLRVAYHLVTGKEAPAIGSSTAASAGYVKRKLKTWSKKSPALRSKVLGEIKSHGKTGVEVDLLVCRLLALDQVASHDIAGEYKISLEASIRALIVDLESRRMVDINDGKAVARLQVHEAASLCGYASSYLSKCHKRGIGPSCELGRPGIGHCLTFSYEAIDAWMIARRSLRHEENEKSSERIVQRSFGVLLDDGIQA